MFMKKRRHAELMAAVKNGVGPDSPPPSDSGGDSGVESDPEDLHNNRRGWVNNNLHHQNPGNTEIENAPKYGSSGSTSFIERDALILAKVCTHL